MTWRLPILLASLLTACTTVSRPAAEVGVAFDRNGDIGSFAEGIADPQTRRPVTPDDPVRVASVSKLLVAIGVMKLVEAGKLDLDRDVSSYLGWPLRSPAFPDRPVTLRLLLSHTSSVRDHDDQYAIPLGGTVRGTMADPRSWDLARGPGDGYFAYSNMNFPIVGSIVERATGERFDIWMRREVLEPMKLDACYNWPTCSDSAVARAVELDDPSGKPNKDDLHGRRPACPVMVRDGEPCDLSLWKLGENGSLFAPQGGLRISARGLARVGRMLLNRGTLEGVRILSPESVETLIRPVWSYDGRNRERGGESEGICRYGLAVHHLASRAPGCADDLEGNGRQWVGHSGDAYGLRSGVWIDRERGLGVAYFVTGLAADPPRGRTAFRAAEEHAFGRTSALLQRQPPRSRPPPEPRDR
jgi:CubicO group peptidase (beta-lactamase class C family)